MEHELPIESNSRTGEIYVSAIYKPERHHKGHSRNVANLPPEFIEERERRIQVMMERAENEEPLNGGL